MSTLEEQLNGIKAHFAKVAPDAAKEVMHRATEDLRASGILSRLPAVGTPLPAFELEDTDGSTVRSADRLQNGPLVVTMYRGLW